MRVRGFVVVLMLAFATWSTPEAAAPDSTVLRVSVRHAGSALHPGDIAVVVVDAPLSITGVESEALGAPLTFWAAAPGRWHALAPIPLDTTPASTP
jgi:hypothetical protein